MVRLQLRSRTENASSHLVARGEFALADPTPPDTTDRSYPPLNPKTERSEYGSKCVSILTSCTMCKGIDFSNADAYVRSQPNVGESIPQ